MSTNTTTLSLKKIKTKNEHLSSRELDELQKLIPLVLDKQALLDNLEVSSIEEFENKLNAKTGFVKASLSAEALGYENEYSRLLHLEKEIDERLTINDIDENSKDLKEDFVEEIRAKYYVYFTPTEMAYKKSLDKIIKQFNELDIEARSQVLMNIQGLLAYSPFSKLR